MGTKGPQSQYIPSGSSTQAIIQNLGDYISGELALPGNWSSNLFYSDLKESPVQSKKILANTLEQANHNPMTYLIFFEQSRGYPKNISDFQRKLYSIIEQGSIMLYFEDYFIRLLNKNKLDQCDNIILKYIETLGRQDIGQWDDTVIKIGACCHQFFAKEPELYAQLVFRTKVNYPEDMTDQELLNQITTEQAGLSPNKYNGKICIHDSRSELLHLYRTQQNKF